jgi:glycosyltransferase involved in cell wall biosynthesis
MKILHIIPYFYPAWAYGGTPRVVFDLCKELVKQGHDVTVYTTDTFDKNNRIQHETRNPKPEIPFSASYFDDVVDGIRIRYFRNLSNRLAFTQKIFLTPGFMLRINQGLEGVDVVHLQEYRTLQNISAWQACRKKGIPYVVSAHGAILRIMGREKRKGLFDSMWGYNILRDANKLVALTELEKRQYEEFGIAGEKIEVIPNGIDLTQFASLPEKGSFRKKYGLDTCPIILFLGRIHRIKGIDILIDAFAELMKEKTEAKLIIAGPDDGFKRECGLRIADCGLKQIDLSIGKNMGKKEVSMADVIFTGMVSREEKFLLYVDADVTVLPSRFENFPSVPFESMMCGTPVVVSEACGIAEMIRKADAGYIAKKEDTKNLAQKIQGVLIDFQQAAISVKKGKKLVEEQLNWEMIARKMLQVYKGC